MGGWFRAAFERMGYAVLSADVGTELTAEEAIDRSEIVVFSVPIAGTPSIIRSLSSHYRSDHLLMDLTSIKSGVVDALLESPSEVLSIHPMFGPHADSLTGQTVVVCRARAGALAAEMEQLLEREGALLVHSTAEEHDRLMAVIQGVMHFSSIALAHCMMQLGIDVEKTMLFTSPIYKVRMDMVGRIMAQDPSLYAEIEILNPYAREAIHALNRSSDTLFELIERKDIDGFVSYFEEAASYMGEFKEKALAESNRLLRALQKSAGNS